MDLTTVDPLTSLTAYRHVDFDVLIDGDISELDLTASHVTTPTSGLRGSHGRPPGPESDLDRGNVFSSARSIVSPLHLRQRTAARNRLDPRVEADAARVRTGDRPSRPRGRDGGPSLQPRAQDHRQPHRAVYDRRPSPCCPVRRSPIPTRSRTTPGRRSSALSARARASLTYASATRGFKTGGFNPTSPEAGGRGFAPEWAWSYEGRMKTAFGGGRGGSTSRCFTPTTPTFRCRRPIRPNVFDISNAAAATIDGVEMEAAARLGGASRSADTWPGWTRPTISISRSAPATSP